MYSGLRVKQPLFVLDFNKTWIVSTNFRKILKYKISWKFVQKEPSCSTWKDGQADKTKLIVANMLRNEKIGEILLPLDPKGKNTQHDIL